LFGFVVGSSSVSHDCTSKTTLSTTKETSGELPPFPPVVAEGGTEVVVLEDTDVEAVVLEAAGSFPRELQAQRAIIRSASKRDSERRRIFKFRSSFVNRIIQHIL
jgi:hypothetical protein